MLRVLASLTQSRFELQGQTPGDDGLVFGEVGEGHLPLLLLIPGSQQRQGDDRSGDRDGCGSELIRRLGHQTSRTAFSRESNLAAPAFMFCVPEIFRIQKFSAGRPIPGGSGMFFLEGLMMRIAAVCWVVALLGCATAPEAARFFIESTPVSAPGSHCGAAVHVGRGPVPVGARESVRFRETISKPVLWTSKMLRVTPPTPALTASRSCRRSLPTELWASPRSQPWPSSGVLAQRSSIFAEPIRRICADRSRGSCPW